VTIQIWKN